MFPFPRDSARLGFVQFDLDGPFSAMRVYVVRCRCVIFIICDWLKSVIYGISASDMHACMRLCVMPLWYDGYPHPSIYLSLHSSIHLHTCTRERVNSKWSSQNHDTNNINISKPAAATRHQRAIESIVYLRIWSLALAVAVFFRSIFPFRTHHQRNIHPPHPSFSESRSKNVCKFPSLFCVWNFQLSLFWHIRNIQWAIISTLMEKNAAGK